MPLSMGFSGESSEAASVGLDLTPSLLTLLALVARDVHRAGVLSHESRRTLQMILSELRNSPAIAEMNQGAISILDDIDPIGDG